MHLPTQDVRHAASDVGPGVQLFGGGSFDHLQCNLQPTGANKTLAVYISLNLHLLAFVDAS